MAERIERKPVNTEINKAEPVRFCDEAREWLKKDHIIYPSTGESLISLKLRGYNFRTSFYRGHPGDPLNPDYPCKLSASIENAPSRISEVAINPNKIILPGSNNKTFYEQSKLVKLSSDKIKVRGVKAVIGQVADYAELDYHHLKDTGKDLFGATATSKVFNTATLLSSSPRDAYRITFAGWQDYFVGMELATNVENFADLFVKVDVNGWFLGFARADVSYSDLYIAPLIVPAERK